jgi:hypothetical protein
VLASGVTVRVGVAVAGTAVLVEGTAVAVAGIGDGATAVAVGWDVAVGRIAVGDAGAPGPASHATRKINPRTARAVPMPRGFML